MWSPTILVVAPSVDGLAWFSQREEHVLVEALTGLWLLIRGDPSGWM
jgi:hypothetical protein